MNINDIKANNIEEFFGTLQQSVVESWRKHLKTDKYSEHIALNEFYEEMPDLVDDLIEAWMGINGKVKEYKNNFTEEKIGTIEYLETLKEFVEKGKEDFIEEDELESLCDDILSQIDSTLYKIKELKENKFMNLKEFLSEGQINEARTGTEKFYVAFIDFKDRENNPITVEINVQKQYSRLFKDYLEQEKDKTVYSADDGYNWEL